MISISRTKRFILTFLLLMVGSVGMNNAFASHFAAADIFYDYVGTGVNDRRFLVTLVLYKACEPNNATLPAGSTGISYRSISCNVTSSANLPQIGPPDTLDQLCANFAPINSCRQPGSPWPAFERRIYRDTITLPQACTDWTFYWTSGARNGGILNLANPSGQNIYVEATLNNVARYNNSSPRYLIAPLPYLCVNQPATYLNGPLDPDSDSMRSFNQNPLGTGPANLLGYAGGYSLANPINTTVANPYNVDINTATATFTPQTQGKFVLAFNTTEYDRFSGVELGHVMRDVQVSVLNCSASPPAIDPTPQNLVGGDTIGLNIITVCPGRQISFNVTASSQTVSNTVFLNLNTEIAPLTNPFSFTTTGQGTATVTGGFSWTPQGADIGDYTLIFTAKDSTCNNNQPIVLKSYLVVLIKVLPSITGSPDGNYCPPNGLPWQLGVSGPATLNLPFAWQVLSGSPNSLSCVNCDSPFATPAQTTVYEVSTTSSVNLCRTKDTITVTVHPAATFTAGPDLTICVNDTVTLQSVISPLSGMVFNWLSNPTLNDTTILSPKAFPTVTNSYILKGQDQNGCFYRDTTQVIVNGVRPILNAFAGRDTVCPEGGTQLYSTVNQQQCGPAQFQCINGVNSTHTLGNDLSTSSWPTPFYTTSFSGGAAMSIIYRRDELEAAGVKPGFINSISFNVATKASTAPFTNTQVFMGCTQQADIPGTNGSVVWTPLPGLVPVFNGNITTAAGWTTIQFNTPFYWDGSGNLAVEICHSKVYSISEGTADVVYYTNTAYNSIRYITTSYYPGQSTTPSSACTYPSAIFTYYGAQRPNTRFNVCVANNYTYQWSPSAYLNDPTLPNPTISGINTPTQYVLTVTAASNANCQSKDTVDIEIDRSNAVDATPDQPYIMCRPDYLQLNAVGIGPRPLYIPSCGTTQNPFGGIGTAGADSVSVGSGIASNNTAITPYYSGSWQTSRMQMLFRRDELVAAGLRPGTLKSLAFVVAGFPTLSPYNNFRISLACTGRQTMEAADGLTPGAEVVFTSPTPVTPQSGWNEYVFTNPYNWDGSSNLIVEVCWANTSYGSSQPVQFTNTSFNSMLRTNSASGNVCNGANGTSTAAYNLRPNIKLKYTEAGDTTFQFTWVPGTYLSDSTIANPLAYVPQTSKWYVYTRGRNECLVRDSVVVYVPVHNFSVGPKDTAICYGESLMFQAGGGGVQHVWYENGYNAPTTLSCADCPNPVATPLEDTRYTLVVGDSVNCTDTFQMAIRVKPLPKVNILQGDTLIKYGQSVTLRVTGADLYYWTPVLGLSAGVGTTVLASPTETTKYVVSGLATNGCRGLDSMIIKVDPSDNLFVPSAFSPNGDGQNDVFKVANLSFQRLMEFRVFNRYGQEIFSTTDIKKGWDGTWKGVPQDMGTYQYLIRVAFPDGLVETYKGDVTLIR